MENGFLQGNILSNRLVRTFLCLIAGWICLWGETDPSCSKTLHTLRTTGLADGIVEFKSGEQVRNMFEMLDGPMDRHVGYFNPACV